MANVKISALTSASTPLAGTEVLPIVQSSATVKVAVADLTAGRAISALTLNSLTVGLGAGSVATNTAVGLSALAANTTGAVNLAVGYQALAANTTGNNSVAVGYRASYSSANASGMVSIGTEANLNNVTSGNTYSTAVGYQAAKGAAGSINYDDVAVGSFALLNVTSGIRNVAVGKDTLVSNTTGSNNTAVGYQAGYANTTGTSNVALGGTALYSNTTASDNVAVGNTSLYSNTTGAFNTSIGRAALQSNTTANNNTAVGYQAGYSNTTGAGNTCFGYVAGNTTTTGQYNVFIGPATVASGTGTSQEVIIGSSGGAAVTGKGANTGFFNANGGGVYQGNNSSTWSTTSDQRLKKNIVDNTVGLDAITSIRVRNFEYRTEDEVTELSKHCVIQKEGVQLGVIAQELQAVLPDCVKQESTGVLSVNTDNLTWYLVNAIKELKAEIDQLKGNV
jgi:hypothetical protein